MPGHWLPFFSEVPLTLPSTYPSGKHGAFRGGVPGALLRLRADSPSVSILQAPGCCGPSLRLRIHICLFHAVSAPCSQKQARPFQVKASWGTGSREQTGKEQQVWGSLGAQENFSGPHFWSPGSPGHPSASAHPDFPALTSARKTELTSLCAGRGAGESPTFLPPLPQG